MKSAYPTLIRPRDERTQPARIVPGYPQTPWRTPKERLIRREPTLSELTGPLEVAGRVKLLGGDIAGHGDRQAIGQLMHLRVRVLDEDGAPVGGTVVEIWQADAAGIYRHPADPRHARADADFLGWGRAATDSQGNYRFRTIRPGAPQGRAAHVNFMVMFSGLMRILKTTLFFEKGSDPVLDAVPPSRQDLLLAKQEKPGRYRFDIRLRGENETPFLDD